jgi:hypothetical protein
MATSLLLKFRRVLFLAVLALLLVSFQNCGQAFQVSRFESAAALISATTPAPQKKTRDPFFGIAVDIIWENVGPSDVTAAVKLLSDLGVGTIRMPIRWLVIQDPGADCRAENLSPRPSNIAIYQSFIDQLPSDVEVIAYLETPPDSCKALYISDPTAFAESYASYVKLAVSTFKTRVHTWQIWNEPNNNPFFPQPANTTIFTASDFAKYIYKPGVSAIQSADPKAVIAGSSLALDGTIGFGTPQSFMPWNSPTIPQYVIPNFLDDFLKASTGFVSNIDIHPYTFGYGPNGSDLDAYDWIYGPNGTVATLKANGIQSMPLYWSETGITLAEAGSEVAQATYLTQLMTEATRAREDANFPLKSVCWFGLRDSINPNAPNPYTDTAGYGLYDNVAKKPRAAYFAYQAFIKAHQRLN